MRPYDAIFLALLASRCLDRPKRWWLVVIAPTLAFGIGLCEPLGTLIAPLTALTAVALVPRWAPVCLLLMVPSYGSLTESLGAGVTWLCLTALFESLVTRLQDVTLAPSLRGWPVHLLALGVLYYTLLPLAWS